VSWVWFRKWRIGVAEEEEEEEVCLFFSLGEVMGFGGAEYAGGRVSGGGVLV